MHDTATTYVLALNVIQFLIGIVFFYLLYRTHPCWKFFLILHGLFTLDAYYIEGLPLSFSFMAVSIGIFILSLIYLRGETGEHLNRLIDDKIIKRFSFKN